MGGLAIGVGNRGPGGSSMK